MSDGSASFVLHHPPRACSFLCLARRTKKKRETARSLSLLAPRRYEYFFRLAKLKRTKRRGARRDGLGRGLQISSDRDDRMGARRETQKNPWTKIQTPKNPMLKVTNTDENERLWKAVKLGTSFQRPQLQWVFFNLLPRRLFVFPRLLLYFMCYLYTLLMFGGAIFIFFSILGL